MLHAYSIFASSNVVGSPNKLYELLVAAAETWPVDGNHHGSYLTFRSRQGVIFAAVVSRLKLVA